MKRKHKQISELVDALSLPVVEEIRAARRLMVELLRRVAQ